MSYAQTNYQQKQGMTVNGRVPYYTIAQIGCFITSFCNLLERFGEPIDPPTLDNQLAARRAYTDIDDGIYDDVGWGTITAFDPSVVVTSTGTGSPPHSNAIVKVIYRSPNSGQMVTHFSLVADAARGLILDSWDGKIKSWDIYGGPKEWATYEKLNAQAPSVNSGAGGTGVIVGDGDNWFARFNKTMVQIRGREAGRAELAPFVGQDSLHMLEAISDSPEADQATADQQLGQLARRDNWQGQIYGLQDQLTTSKHVADTLNQTLTQVQSDNNATKQDLKTALVKAAALTAELQTANDKLVDIQKQQASDQSAGDSFLRRLGQFIKKYLGN